MFKFKENIYCSQEIEKLWEYDFLKYILEPFYESDFKILIYSQNNKNINEIINFKNYYNPDILIHLSDEWGIWNWQEIMYKNVKLVLRQYMFGHYPKYPNVYQIPLGYMSNYLKNKTSIKPVKDRSFFWGFCGNINKVNRLGKSNNILNYIEKYPHNYTLKIEPENMFDIYNNSVFMPNRRGNISLDCLRIYEACMAGCIPIVEGSLNELTKIFSFNLNIDEIPFIFIENYENNVNRIENLYNDKELLQKMSDDCILWFNNQISSIRQKIKEISS